MKFLEKIEDAINAILEKIGDKLWKTTKSLTPDIIPHYFEIFKKSIPIFLEKIKSIGPKFKILFLKLIGYSQHYLHLVKGKLHAGILYLRSDEFKNANKKDLFLAPVLKLKGSFKVNPFKTTFAMIGVFTILFGTKIITKEISLVKNGLMALRAPASNNLAIEEDNKLDLGVFLLKENTSGHGTSHADPHATSNDAHGAPAKADAHGAPAKADAHGAPAKADAHGAPAKADAHGAPVAATATGSIILTGPELPVEKFEPKPFNETSEFSLEIKLLFKNSKIKNSIESDHNLVHELKHLIEHLGIPSGLSTPLDDHKKKQIIDNFESHMHDDAKFKNLFKTEFSWEINQEEIKKPRYHLAYLRQYRFTDVGLQLLLEDTKRNKQVYFEFVIQTKNREGVSILKHHEVEIKDHLMMNIEPVVPGLPLDDEGKRIIRDKVKFEVNSYLKHHHLETEIEEVFIDYILAS